MPWRLLTRAGHIVVFATETGAVPTCDQKLIDGVLFGQLGAEPEPIAFYREMEQSKAFRAPIRWDAIDPAAYDGLLLPGGHAKGMRQYLGCAALQRTVAAFAATGKPIAAICHGVLLLARSKEAATGLSVLHDRRVTCLPFYMERVAYFLTFWWLGGYYRTYELYVETEVRAALHDPAAQFERGPITLTARGTASDDAPAFVVRDGNLVTARWPGDAYKFAREFMALLPQT